MSKEDIMSSQDSQDRLVSTPKSAVGPLFYIITHDGKYWKKPSHGVTRSKRMAKKYTSAEIDKHRPMFGFWNSEAMPCES